MSTKALPDSSVVANLIEARFDAHQARQKLVDAENRESFYKYLADRNVTNHGRKFYGQEEWADWYLVSRSKVGPDTFARLSTREEEDLLMDLGLDPDPYYGGIGCNWTDRPTVWRTPTRILVKVFGGVDV